VGGSLHTYTRHPRAVCGGGSLACSPSREGARKHEIEFVNCDAPERMFGAGNTCYIERMFDSNRAMPLGCPYGAPVDMPGHHCPLDCPLRGEPARGWADLPARHARPLGAKIGARLHLDGTTGAKNAKMPRRHAPGHPATGRG
jgi:hypothetical protein